MVDVATKKRQSIGRKRVAKAMPSRGVPQSASHSTAAAKEYLLGQVRRRRITRDEAEAAFVSSILEARAAEATWRELGDAAGVSAQAVRKRFGPVRRGR
jgi:hypothetical protein